MYGLCGWENYKYENEQQKSCRKALYKKVLESHYVKKYLEIELKGDEDCMMKLIHKIGPMAVAVHADEFFMSYANGFYKNETCPTTDPNHAMVICGYGTDTKFGDYWLVRNSWVGF
jgi:Papain family cysteine protease